MRKILRQIVATCEGWEAVFFSYGDGDLFREPIVCRILGLSVFEAAEEKNKGADGLL